MVLTAFAGLSWAGGVYLEPGIGISPLQLGRLPPRERVTNVDGWQQRQDGVQYTVDKNSGVVILIRCTMPQCVTIRSLRVGQSDTELWRRLGAPLKTRDTADGKFFEYDGIGFLVRDTRITAIFVLPRLRR